MIKEILADLHVQRDNIETSIQKMVEAKAKLEFMIEAIRNTETKA